MTLTQKDVDWIHDHLPDFADAQRASNFINDGVVQHYLNHYQINFTREFQQLRHRLGHFHCAGFKLACHHWQPADVRGTVFFLHGYTDNVGLMHHAIRSLLQQRWAVVAFDLPGHGISSGERGHIQHFDQYRQCLEGCLTLCDELSKPWLGAGQSTGGAIWFNFFDQHRQQTDISSAVLFAPLVRIYNWPRLRWLLPLVKVFLKRTRRTFTENSHDREFLQFVRDQDLLQPPGTPMDWVVAMKQALEDFLAASPNPIPLKIISGDRDRTVDADWNLMKIQQHYPQADITVVPEVRHQVVNEAEPYREKIFASMHHWLNQFAND